MKILGLLRADADSEAGAPPTSELISRMGTFMDEVTKAGILLATDGLQPSSKGKRVRLADGKVNVIDGPFAESKELIASYALFQVNTMEEAVDWTRRFLEVLGSGEVELRPIFELTDFPSDVVPPHEAEREQAWRAEMERNAGRP